MEKANFGQLVSFIFGIANDCLVDGYDVGDYTVKSSLALMVADPTAPYREDGENHV